VANEKNLVIFCDLPINHKILVC